MFFFSSFQITPPPPNSSAGCFVPVVLKKRLTWEKFFYLCFLVGNWEGGGRFAPLEGEKGGRGGGGVDDDDIAWNALRISCAMALSPEVGWGGGN